MKATIKGFPVQTRAGHKVVAGEYAVIDERTTREDRPCPITCPYCREPMKRCDDIAGLHRVAKSDEEGTEGIAQAVPNTHIVLMCDNCAAIFTMTIEEADRAR